FVAGIGIILQIFLEMIIPNIRGNADIIISRIDPDIIVVLTIDQGCVRKQPAAQDMIPPESGRSIAIVKTESISQAKIIFSKIPRQINMIFLPEFIIRLDIDIVKIKTALGGVGIFRQFEK